MTDRVKLIIDGVDISQYLTGLSVTYNWIVDSYRNQNDYAIITNPVKKCTISAKADKLTEAQFDQLVLLVGKKDITHTVTAYDDLQKKLVSYKMYNSDLSFDKQPYCDQVIYTGTSFSLIER